MHFLTAIVILAAEEGGESGSNVDLVLPERSELIAGVIAPRIPSREARVLDVGCASGRLLANIRDLGFPNVVGLDPSPACAAIRPAWAAPAPRAARWSRAACASRHRGLWRRRGSCPWRCRVARRWPS